jgi:hypothetical protein
MLLVMYIWSAITAQQDIVPAFQHIPYFDQTMVAIEAENFTVASGSRWSAMEWGQPANGSERTGFFAATVANTFHSRRGYLNAPEDASPSDTASAKFVVPQDDDYAVLVRYEHGYRFNAAFKVAITSIATSKEVFTREYGWRENLKLWAFASARNGPDGRGGSLCGNQGHSGAGLQAECLWPYGSTENMVWEGIGASVNLSTGEYTVTISGLNEPSVAEGGQ